MAEKKNNKGLGLQETKGSFQIRGKLTGCDKDKSKGMGRERHGKRAVSENGRMWSGM